MVPFPSYPATVGFDGGTSGVFVVFVSGLVSIRLIFSPSGWFITVLQSTSLRFSGGNSRRSWRQSHRVLRLFLHRFGGSFFGLYRLGGIPSGWRGFCVCGKCFLFVFIVFLVFSICGCCSF